MKRIIYRHTQRWAVVGGLCAGMVFADAARGEVEVSVTLTGPIEEIIPILHLINDLGAGKQSAGAPLEVEVHSAFSDTEAEAPAAPVAPPMAAPTEPAPPAETAAPAVPLAVTAFTVQPTQAAPGAQVTAKATIYDQDGKVDTVAVRVSGVDGLSFELFDNASGGDEVAGDGVWTGVFLAPAALPDGGELVLTAFDAYGDRVDISATAALTLSGN